MRRWQVVLAFISVLALMLGCTASGSPPPTTAVGGNTADEKNSVDSVEIKQPVELVFWHRQVGDSETLQQALIDEFMAANPNIKIKAESLGDYTKLYEKVLASIQANSPPDVVAAYESQASDYYKADALVPFDDYIKSKKYGLTDAELADYIPSYLEATKFSQFDGKSLTFPYTKSDLVMYTNMEVLRSLGFQQPAQTWDEFLAHCRAAVAAGRQGYAMPIDASTFDGFVYSFGGELVNAQGTKTRFDEQPVARTLQLYETLAKEKLAYQIQGTDDQNDLLSGKALYMIRSSTSIPRLSQGFGDNDRWQVGIIPQGTAGPTKSTVLYGANISIMKSTPEKQLAAWLFIKWLTSPDVTARWGLDKSNGYFPVRVSALTKPGAADFLKENPHFQQAFEVSKVAKVEPSAAGWQEVRTYIEDAMTGIINGRVTAAQAQQQLLEKSNRALSQS